MYVNFNFPTHKAFRLRPVVLSVIWTPLNNQKYNKSNYKHIKRNTLYEVTYNRLEFDLSPMVERSKKDEKRIQRIGERIRELRKEAGYTSYEDFAFDNEIPRVQYGRMEKGVNFRIATLMRVLEVHKISLEEFFKGLK